MVLPRETILTGAALTCSDCGVTPELKVCHSPAGQTAGLPAFAESESSE